MVVQIIAFLPSKFSVNSDAERGSEVELVLDEVQHVHQEPLGGDHVPVFVKCELGREHGVLDERGPVEFEELISKVKVVMIHPLTGNTFLTTEPWRLALLRHMSASKMVRPPELVHSPISCSMSGPPLFD